MAESVVIRVDTFWEPMTGDCATCGFESLVHIKILRLNSTGVSVLADRIVCSRACGDE